MRNKYRKHWLIHCISQRKCDDKFNTGYWENLEPSDKFLFDINHKNNYYFVCPWLTKDAKASCLLSTLTTFCTLTLCFPACFERALAFNFTKLSQSITTLAAIFAYKKNANKLNKKHTKYNLTICTENQDHVEKENTRIL